MTSARYAVVGNPVAHSLSPAIHSTFARQTGVAMSYDRLLAPIDGFLPTVRDFFAGGGQGLNVTVPFKIEAFDFATRRTARAELAGAVNTLRVYAGGVEGENTDGIGLVRDLERLTTSHGLSLAASRILILGAGGATRGVIGPLAERQPAILTVANRSLNRARELVQHFVQVAPMLDIAPFTALVDRRFDIVINATSAGYSADKLDVPDSLFARAELVYDMSYALSAGGPVTPFLAQAHAGGAARVSDGLGMLVEQAAESFYFWTGNRPETGSVLALVRKLRVS